jgi:hypothetical protein
LGVCMQTVHCDMDATAMNYAKFIYNVVVLFTVNGIALVVFISVAGPICASIPPDTFRGGDALWLLFIPVLYAAGVNRAIGKITFKL